MLLYWERVLNEVLNSNDPRCRFLFTNLGEYKRRQLLTCSITPKKKRSKNMKLYALGGNYEGIYFTRREAECMLLLLEGRTMASVATALKLSHRTIEFYTKNMKNKLKCHTKEELVRVVSTTKFKENVDFSVI